MITIEIKEYIELLIAKEKLDRLEEGGVDNWEWYGDSLQLGGDFKEWKNKLKEKYKKEDYNV